MALKGGGLGVEAFNTYRPDVASKFSEKGVHILSGFSARAQKSQLKFNLKAYKIGILLTSNEGEYICMFNNIHKKMYYKKLKGSVYTSIEKLKNYTKNRLVK